MISERWFVHLQYEREAIEPVFATNHKINWIACFVLFGFAVKDTIDALFKMV